MELAFEYSSVIGSGSRGVAYHSPDNVLQVMYINPDGRIRATEAETPLGYFGDLEFDGNHQVSPNEPVEHLNITYLPRINIFVTWKHNTRHRKGVIILKQEMDKYLEEGQITMQHDTSVSRLRLRMKNPGNVISSDTDANSQAFPGTQIRLFLRMGRRDRYPLGIFYVDRVGFSVGNPIVTIDGRNASGKLLADQTFNQDNEYEKQPVHLILEDILDKANVPIYEVDTSDEEIGIKFPPNMSYFQGIEELLNLTDEWIIRESIDGKITIGHKDSTTHDIPGTYEFSREIDCFTRELDRDDADVYAQVCVHDREFNVAAYRDITVRNRWSLARNKTMFVEVPEGTTNTQASRLASNIANRAAGGGMIHTFSGPIRPHIQTDDAAKITMGSNEQMLGTITELTTTFGVSSGFYTTFTVDSGGQLKKPSLKDLIDRVNDRSSTRSVEVTE